MLKILHLSDLHFGIEELPQAKSSGRKPKNPAPALTKSAHRFANGTVPNPNELIKILERDGDFENPDLIIVSGDIGWSGVKDDYIYAEKFFATLKAKCPKAQLIVAPGNHDVDRKAASKDKAQEAFIAFIRKLFKSQLQARYPFLPASNSKQINRESLVSFDYSPDNYLVVTVNSAAHLHQKPTPVYLSTKILEDIEQEISRLGVSGNTLRIFVLHHHLLPFAEPNWGPVVDLEQQADRPDPTTVANSAKLQVWLDQQQFRIVLHGHKHLSHGRLDTLWRGDDPASGRKVLVLGAGSVGVAADHRHHGESLNFNVLTVGRLSTNRWSVKVSTKKILEGEAVPRPKEEYSYSAELGPMPSGHPLVFCAESMDDCHNAIANGIVPNVLLKNFISIVENPEYIHPKTAIIGKEKASQDQVERSFLALHPELDGKIGWQATTTIDRALQKVGHRYQFQHGPRLFGYLGMAIGQNAQVPDEKRPIFKAASNVNLSKISHAYAGLYNPSIDLSNDQPLPGLMSVQFVGDGRYLDAVATFRKLELSYWWAVNMLEIGELLRWAAAKAQPPRLPRRITFFAGLAEWKDDPEATFTTSLDQTPLEELARLVFSAYSGCVESRAQLATLLQEKAEHTNAVSLDETGLRGVASILNGLARSKDLAGKTTVGAIHGDLPKFVTEAAASVKFAIDDGDNRAMHISSAIKSLRLAVQVLM